MNTRKIGFIALSAFLVVGTSSAISAAPQNRSDYVIKFVDSANLDNEVAAIKGNGGNVKETYAAIFKGAAVNLSDSQAQGLAHNPRIQFIEKDAVVTADTTETAQSWGLARIDQTAKLDAAPYSYSYTSTGSGVTAYVIDTGIDITNPDFGGRAKWGTNTVDRKNTDCNGHGTHVSGTIGGTKYGVAKNVNLVAVKVLGCTGSGTLSGVISGMNWVAKVHPLTERAVASMSLGASFSSTVNAAVDNLTADGVTVVVAAGNSAADACTFSPASATTAITVGASEINDAQASYSNFGSCVELYAPGTNITSDWLSGKTNTISGTSMATPHVSGVVARMLSTAAMTPAQVSSALIAASTNGMLTGLGAGSPNRLLFIDPAN